MIRKLFLNEKLLLGLIVINSIILFIGGYLTKESHTFIFLVADNLITTLFITELVVKLKEFGIKKYFNSGWNKLDFILIVLSLPSLISFLFSIQLFDVSFLLVFRVLRVFKTFRFFQFIPNVEELVRGVKRALQTSAFIIVGFSIYIFIIGILSFYLFQNSQTDYYSTPTASLYTTFKVFTIEGWFEIPEELSASYSSSTTFFIYLYFVFLVTTGGIIGLSLVNSIFVDSMVSDNNDNIEDKIDHLDNKLNNIIQRLNNHET